jgi:hypothetical protein
MALAGSGWDWGVIGSDLSGPAGPG